MEVTFACDRNRPSQRVGTAFATRLARHNLRLPRSGGLVSFTFDGFAESAAQGGAPILEAHGARGTFYTAPGLWGQQWRGAAMSTAETVDSLHHSGHEIGCHPHDGSPVDRLPAEDRDRLVTLSLDAFRDSASDRRFSSFAYPEGAVNVRAKRQVSRRFASCRGMVAGLNTGTVDLALLRSVHLADATLDLAGVNELLRRTQQRHGWLIFRSGQVESYSPADGCSPQLLDHAVLRAAQLGLRILPVRHAVGALLQVPA